jgi:hypothetical protein
MMGLQRGDNLMADEELVTNNGLSRSDMSLSQTPKLQVENEALEQVALLSDVEHKAGQTQPPLSGLISECQQVMWNVEARKTLQDNGVNLTPANFYSSTPLFSDLDTTFEAPDGIPAPIYSDIFDKDAMAAFLDLLAPYSAEFNPPNDADENAPDGFFWNNSQFSDTDALAYYCMLRHLKPLRVVEIGSGFSTLVADAAMRQNGFGEIVCIEPCPRPFLAHILSVRKVIRRPIQDIHRNEFLTLAERSEVLFIDSTHTVKIGSDCLYIYLHLLPAIRRRIVVHSHDIFLPFGMPTEWVRDSQIYWTEQYLLYAFLLRNPSATVLFGSTYAERFLSAQARDFLPAPRPLRGGSLWYELNRPADAP